MTDVGKRYRHKVRGSTYTVMGEVTLQTSARVSDGAQLTVYSADETGELWVRPSHEFYDGRFEETGPAPDKPDAPLAHDAIETALASLGVPLAFGAHVTKTGAGYGGPGHVCGVAIAEDGSPRIIVAHKIEGGNGRLMHIYSKAQISAGGDNA